LHIGAADLWNGGLSSARKHGLMLLAERACFSKSQFDSLKAKLLKAGSGSFGQNEIGRQYLIECPSIAFRSPWSAL
jgi:hypothetical protein